MKERALALLISERGVFLGRKLLFPRSSRVQSAAYEQVDYSSSITPVLFLVIK